jgi:hypothetical protein
MKIFKSLIETEQFKIDNCEYLAALQSELNSLPGVVYSEIWLNGNSPSCVIGFDAEDQQFVSLII